MIDHLYIHAHESLPNCPLFQLGRINVVCGKNSSGKSTLLRALVRGVAPGVTFVGQLHDRLVATVANQIQDGGNPTVRQEIVKAINAILQAHDAPCWFSVEADDFVTLFGDEREANYYYLSRLPWNENALRKSIKDLFPTSVGFTLIPAKRRLEVGASIDTNASVAPEGPGLLNKLAFLRNQPDGSTDRTLYSLIEETFSDVSDGFAFEVIQGSNNTVYLRFSRDRARWGDADAFGLGLQDLLLLIYFAHAPNIHRIAIEEPETHMHPDMQRRLIAHLAKTDKQYFLATHSNVFLSGVHTDRVLLTRFSDDTVTVHDVTSRAEALTEMGFAVSDNINPDLVLLVEGPNDVAAFSEFLGKFELSDKFAIRIWPLGGDSMKRVELKAFEGQEVLAVIDKDPDSRTVREEFVELCNKENVRVFQLRRYGLENYFPLDAYRTVFPDQRQLDELKELKHAQRVQKQIGFDPKRKDNVRKLAKLTPRSFLEGTDIADLMRLIGERAVARSLNRHRFVRA